MTLGLDSKRLSACPVAKKHRVARTLILPANDRARNWDERCEFMRQSSCEIKLYSPKESFCDLARRATTSVNFPRSPVDNQDRSSGFIDRLRENNFQGRCVCSEIVLADVNRDLSIQESGAEHRGMAILETSAAST